MTDFCGSTGVVDGGGFNSIGTMLELGGGIIPSFFALPLGDKMGGGLEF